MKIIEKINAKQDFYNNKPVTIAFLGDSVTHGCFECFMRENNVIDTKFEMKSAYSQRVREILNVMYPSAQINIVDSGISGDNAVSGLNRLERDVLPYSPDLVVVSYGLNDAAGGGREGMKRYTDALDKIFRTLKERDIEVVFLTQNAMSTKVTPMLKDEPLRKVASDCAVTQNEGILKEYFESAKETAAKNGVPVCDLYKYWELMINSGVDVSENMLANHINHPIREYHYYIAAKLVETFLEN